VRACFGTTKYCNAFLKGIPCNNGDCLYLHAVGAQGPSVSRLTMLHPSKAEANYYAFLGLNHV